MGLSRETDFCPVALDSQAVSYSVTLLFTVSPRTFLVSIHLCSNCVLVHEQGHVEGAQGALPACGVL